MKQLMKWLNLIIKKQKKLKRWQRVLTVLASVLIFATTYALILPAITVERDSTEDVGGMYLKDALKNEGYLEDLIDEDSPIPSVILKSEGPDYTVTIACDESSGVPADVSLEVAEIPQDTEEYASFLAEARNAMGLSEEEELPKYAARFFDIKIMSEGEEFKPESGVTVEIAYSEPLAENPETEVSTLHFADETQAAQIVDISTPQIMEDGAAAVRFQTESFSVYGVIYTVDLHWEVNGQVYDFSIPGGGYADLGEVIEVLGIADNNKAEENVVGESTTSLALEGLEVSETSKDFIANVTSVEFSNPDLMWVGQASEATTVGAIKEANELKALYSADLTEEQVAAIDAQSVEAGEWVLISLKPFTSTEALTVTMKDGDQFKVVVTDAQIVKEVTIKNPDGEDVTYLVTVSGGMDAKLPSDATLSVTELDPESEAYKAAREKVITAEKEKDENFNESYLGLKALDITILDAEGNPIEPAAPVKVTMQIKELPDNIAEETFLNSAEVLHLNKSTGEEVLETVAEPGAFTAESGASATFTVDSFSEFLLKWTGGEATIHFIDTDDQEIDEDQVLIDTSDNTGTLSLRNNFDGYSYMGASYSTDGGNTKEPIDHTLIHRDGKWYANIKQTSVGGTTTLVETEIADGSDIYAVYAERVTYDESGNDVSGPITKKTISDNHDGTQTITLDVKAPIVEETTPESANILIVLDTTTSMSYAMNSSGDEYDQESVDPPNRRWDAEKAALHTMVEALEGNNIQYGLLDFHVGTFGRFTVFGVNYGADGRNRDTAHRWNPTTGEHTTSNTGTFWTSNGDAFLDQIDSMGPAQSEYTGTRDSYRNTFTNWESPLYSAMNILNTRNANHTYVIFVTDGQPNHYGGIGNGTIATAGWVSQATLWDLEAGYFNVEQCVNAATQEAQAIAGLDNVSFYGVFCGRADGYEHLRDLITAAGGVKTINGRDEETLKSEFIDIAHTVIESFGSSNVSVDDGVTELSSVSAQLHADNAGGYEYYLATVSNPQDSDFNVWEGAPAATFSDDNGVTWDLSNEGVLKQNYTYRLKFKIWPSQAAYDMIANLNNETVKIPNLTSEEKAQLVVTVGGMNYEFVSDHGWTPVPYDPDNPPATYTSDAALQQMIEAPGASATYALKTNTHLFTTFDFKGNTYTDPFDKGNSTMPLDTDILYIIKEWNDKINTRNKADYIEFYLMSDGKYYTKDGTTSDDPANAELVTLYKNGTVVVPDPDTGVVDGSHTVTTSPDDSWKDSIYIAPGLATLSGTTVSAYENGHEFTLVEKAGYKWREENGVWSNEYEPFSMEFETQTVHPMVIYIDGVRSVHNFVLIDEDHPAPSGETVYTIVQTDGTSKEYYLVPQPSTLRGANNKTPELDITKHISEESVTELTDEELDEEEFTYTVTFNFPEGSDPSGVGYWVYEPYVDSGDSWPVPEYDEESDYQPDNYTDGELFTGVDSTSIWGGQVPAIPLAGATEKTVSVTIKRSEIIRFTHLPTGTTYTIVESAANGNTLASEGYTVDNINAGYGRDSGISVNTGVTVDTDNATVSGEISETDTRYYHRFSNKLNTVEAELKVTKALSGYTWAQGDPSYTFNLTAITQGAPMPATTTVTVNDPSEMMKSFGNIEYVEGGEYDYQITEIAGTNPNIVYGDPVKVRVTVTNTNGVLSVSNITGLEGATVEFTPATSSASASVVASGRATITNTMQTADIKIRKLGEDGETLDGAKFVLVSGNENAVHWDGTAWVPVGDPNDTEYPNSFVVTNGEVTITGLPLGTYKLIEKKAPSGHIIKNSTVEFELKKTSGTTTIDILVEVENASAGGDTITITNTPGAELPMTGGPGTLLYTLSGIALICVAALMFGFRMRRRERRLN